MVGASPEQHKFVVPTVISGSTKQGLFKLADQSCVLGVVVGVVGWGERGETDVMMTTARSPVSCRLADISAAAGELRGAQNKGVCYL